MRRLSNLRFELNSAGVRQLLRSEARAAGLESTAAAIAGRCGAGYASDRKLMPTRVISSVYTAEDRAYRDNMQNNTILRSLK